MVVQPMVCLFVVTGVCKSTQKTNTMIRFNMEDGTECVDKMAETHLVDTDFLHET